MSSDVRVELAGPAFDAVAHLLASLPRVSSGAPLVTGAASLSDARYVAWAEALPEEATRPAREDGTVLAALLAQAPGGERLQALLVLHEAPEELARAASEPLAEAPCGGPSWAKAALLALADESPTLVELARCTVALLAVPYARAWERLARPELEAALPAVEAALSEVARAAPAVRDARVVLSHPLGPHGRGLGERIAVGAPLAWWGGAAEDAAVLVLHELAVELAGEVLEACPPGEAWARGERLALEAVEVVLDGSRLAERHRAWVQGLSTDGLAPRGAPQTSSLVARLRARASSARDG